MHTCGNGDIIYAYMPQWRRIGNEAMEVMETQMDTYGPTYGNGDE